MKKMKPICFALAIVMTFALLPSCGKRENSDENATNALAGNSSRYTELKANSGETVTIPVDEITQTARFFNYDANGVVVQLVALRDKNGGPHIAFNTCQSCSPSPKAYYQQSGDVLQCTNCGFTFEPEEVGVTQGGCNPWPIDGAVLEEKQIKIPVSSLDNMRSVFASWVGPTK